MYLIILFVLKLSASVLSSPHTRFIDNRLEFKDSVVMADIIGSGALNFQHYFHSLGVICENRNPGAWTSIDKDYKDCENFMSKRNPKGFPYGSFNKACAKWEINRQCETNLALDLDDCLGDKKGSDALRFLDAYAGFTCPNIRKTEAHLVDRLTKRDYLVPGVFRCFPHLQDRISSCVKKEFTSPSFCSQFYTVHQCYGKYYADESCNDPQAIVYMRDLFRSMSRDLKCPQTQDDWDNRVYLGNQGLSTSFGPPYETDPYILTSRRPPIDNRLVSSTRRPSTRNRPVGTPRSTLVTLMEYPYIIPPGIGTNFDQRIVSTARPPVNNDRFISSTISPVDINDRYIYISTTGGQNHLRKRKKNGTLRPLTVPITSHPLRISSSTSTSVSNYLSTSLREVGSGNNNKNRNVFRSH